MVHTVREVHGSGAATIVRTTGIHGHTVLGAIMQDGTVHGITADGMTHGITEAAGAGTTHGTIHTTADGMTHIGDIIIITTIIIHILADTGQDMAAEEIRMTYGTAQEARPVQEESSQAVRHFAEALAAEAQ